MSPGSFDCLVFHLIQGMGVAGSGFLDLLDVLGDTVMKAELDKTQEIDSHLYRFLVLTINTIADKRQVTKANKTGVKDDK